MGIETDYRILRLEIRVRALERTLAALANRLAEPHPHQWSAITDRDAEIILDALGLAPDDDGGTP